MVGTGIQTLNAQQPGFKRTILQKQDLSAQGREGVMLVAEFAPGAAAGKHTHPGEEIGYVLEGSLVLEVEGKPAVTLKAGDVFFVEAGRVHDGKNPGNKAAKVVSTLVVEKGKPLATPVK
ncbi:MAG: cupin domain-containing protein [Candidatus Rokubacteria bacterium]|nr:cupin domain-containing protein [Candidatus Rokubacteria bacterium]